MPLTLTNSALQTNEGIFSCSYTASVSQGRGGLFLDRDGVIVQDVHYLHRVEDISFIPGVAEAIACANRLSIPVVMVTNQAGIGRGYFGWEDFQAVQQIIFAHCKAHEAHFDMVLACAYHADGLGAYAITDHPWRKPNPGMLLEAARVTGVDLARSFIVGDSISDLVAGKAAGLHAGALVHTGHGVREWEKNGKAQFEHWNDEGHFIASRMDNAAVAIHKWLNEFNLIYDVG